ncbi:MAG: 6-phosphogluconolactonase [Limisphaerales bacterium]
MTGPVDLIAFDSAEALAQTAAARWLEELAAAACEPTPYCVALSGGRITGRFFAEIADGATRRSLSLARVHFFWADERCVPPVDAESNFGLAFTHLFQPLEIAPDRIHRVRGEEPAEFAVAEAEAELCRIAPLNECGVPVLDMIFLGMGEDGHVASLFPGAPGPVTECPGAYCHVTASKPPPERITISFAALATARRVWVLASGPGKAQALRESLAAHGNTPLARVLRERASTTVFTDIPLPG